MAESNEMLKHHSELLQQYGVSNGDKLSNVKKEIVDSQFMLENIRTEVKKNYDILVKSKIETCIEQIELFAKKHAGERSKLRDENEKSLKPILKKIDNLDKKYFDLQDMIRSEFARGLSMNKKDLKLSTINFKSTDINNRDLD